jgi:predicted ester cyclase
MTNDIKSRLLGGGPSKRQRDRRKRILDFFEAFNAHDINAIRTFFAERHVDRTFFGHRAIDREAKMRMFTGMFEMFPDWYEQLDEFVSSEGNKLAVRHTGRGTQAKPFLGREPTGRQVAATYTDIITFDDNDQIIEYVCGQFPFTTFFDESIIANDDVMEARAEQGGTLISPSARREINEALQDGLLDHREFLLAKEAAEPIQRCQALLETNLRRCINNAVEGSLYCGVHQTAGWGPVLVSGVAPKL